MIDETRIRDWLSAYHHAWTTDNTREVEAAVRRRRPYFTAPYSDRSRASRP